MSGSWYGFDSMAWFFVSLTPSSRSGRSSLEVHDSMFSGGVSVRLV